MALIGTTRFTDPVLEVDGASDTFPIIITSTDRCRIIDKKSYGGAQSVRANAVVNALVLQGYTIVSRESGVTTLQLSYADAVEDAGATAEFEVQSANAIRAKITAEVEAEKSSGPCFVATACYGDFDHPDVRVFRRWRDRVLVPYSAGRAFVRFYYAVSPPFARGICRFPFAASFIRRFVLAPIARRLSGEMGEG